MNIDRFKHEHRDILDQIAALRQLTHAGVEHNAAAIARGLVSSGELLTGRVSVTDQSRSNVVRRIDLDGRPVAFVKSRGAAATLDGDDPIGAEVRGVYEHHADVSPPFTLLHWEPI